MPGVDILAVFGDMPAAGENETCPGFSIIQHRLGRAGSVLLHAPGHQHGQYAVTTCHRLFNHVAIIGRTGNHGDALLEFIQLGYTLLTADADHFIAPVERMAHHVFAELAGCADDTNFHDKYPLPL